MGVVAPGNKQIGSWTFNLLQVSKPSIQIASVTGFALTQTQTPPTPTQPYNVNLGSYGLTLLVSSKKVMKIESALGLAVVKYSPPTILYFHNALGLAAVKDTGVSVTLALPKNVAIGSLSFNALLSTRATTSIRSVLGLAVVQRFEQRKESTFHSINYGLGV